MLRKIVVLSLAILACSGCSSSRWSKLSSPFERDDFTDIDNGAFAKSKAGQAAEIRRIADEAKSQSPAEQMQSSTALVSRIQDEDDRILRLELVRALGNYRTPAAIEGLRISAADSRDTIRLATCESLGRVRSPDALALLSGILGSDTSLDVRIAAARAISKFEGPQAISALQPAINDADPALQYTAVQAMKKLHSEDLGNSVSAWQKLAQSMSPGSDSPRSNTQIAEDDVLLR